MNAVDTLQGQIDMVLRHLDAPDAPLLGAGMTAAIYALDDQRAVRVHGGVGLDYDNKLRGFYDQLANHPLPYAVPAILETGVIDGDFYHIERRLPGVEMAVRFPQLERQQRDIALTSFLDALPPLHQITFPDRPYGQFLGEGDDLTAPSWSGFLTTMVEAKLSVTWPMLKATIPDIQAKTDDFLRRLSALPDPPQKTLVHGDYFFGNVLLGEDDQVATVLDFSPMSAIGDPLMDIAAAYYFCRIYPFVTDDDYATLRRQIDERYGADVWPRLNLYLIYYAYFLSDCYDSDPVAYAWEIRHLKEYWSLVA